MRKAKVTRKQIFLDEMNRVVPWAARVALIEPYAPKAGPQGGNAGFVIEILLRIHFLQQWFNLSDPAMEEALYDTTLFREFVGIDLGNDRIPDESTILRFRHLLEKHALSARILSTINALLSVHGLLLKSGMVVDATLIAAPSSTKNATGKRDSAKALKVRWHIAMRPGKRRALNQQTPHGQLLHQLEHAKARIRAKVEHAFRVIKCQFGYVKVRHRLMRDRAG